MLDQREIDNKATLLLLKVSIIESVDSASRDGPDTPILLLCNTLYYTKPQINKGC